jgi:flagellar biosynthesis anti-sigma factor FlgM
MKINSTTSSMVNQAYTSQTAGNSQAAKPAPEKKAEQAAVDSVTLSDGSKDLNLVKTSLENEPESRTELVQTLRESIARGTYRVDPEGIADRILGASRFHEIA